MNTVERLVKYLRILNDYCPELSKMVNHVYPLREQYTPEQWPVWCFIPKAVWLRVTKQFYGKDYNGYWTGKFWGEAYCLCCWRYSQGIYEFDTETFDALIKSDSPGKLPADVLLRLPEWCIYIPTPGLRFHNMELSGFFATYDEGPNLLILLDLSNRLEPVPPLQLSNCNIEDAIKGALSTLRISAETAAMIDTSALADNLTPLISLLLYICSEAPEIDNTRMPGALPQRAQPQKVKGVYKYFPATGPTIFKVGQQIGEELRKIKYAEPRPSTTTGHHKRPRPHYRRGHWQHYWTGPKTDAQKLIVKWIWPKLIAALVEDENITHETDE